MRPNRKSPSVSARRGRVPAHLSLDRTRRLLTELGVSTDSLPEPEVLEPGLEELAEAEEEQKKEGMAALYDPALAEEATKAFFR